VINFCQILFEWILSENQAQGAVMRVSEDRYSRDRQKIDLAWRLIHHEARTYTIRQWTGLSDDRIRKLYRSYCLDQQGADVLRHRGKSPRQAAYFFKNTETSFQATQLASLYIMFGLLGGSDGKLVGTYRVGALESGRMLCGAYETYRHLHYPALISFEHAWFLLIALARGDEITLIRCAGCWGLRLHDVLSRHKTPCGNCLSAACGPRTPLEFL
jgi:Flagellar transcriptional activator (FlhC)